MEIINGCRQSGKTTKLIEWLQENPKRLLVVINHNEENRLKRLYPEMRNQFIDWQSYQRAYNNGFFEETAIDNADMILQSMVREPLKKVTMSGDTNREQ